MAENTLSFFIPDHAHTGHLDEIIGGVENWIGKTQAVLIYPAGSAPSKINSGLGYFNYKLHMMGFNVTGRSIDLSGAVPKGIIDIQPNLNPQPLAEEPMVQLIFVGTARGRGRGRGRGGRGRGRGG